MPRIKATLREAEERAADTPERKRDRDVALLAHYRAAFGSASGQVVLADILRRCGYFAPNGDERSAGARDVGIHLVEMITRDPADLMRFALTTETGDLFNERDSNATH